METIILASSGSFLTEGDLSFLPKPIEEMKISRVITASKGASDLSYLKGRDERIKELGLRVEKLDIEGKDEKEIEKILSDVDLIFVEGGNPFYLIKAIRESNFVKVVKKMLRKGKVYLGASAGSYAVCPSIEMAEWKGRNRHNHYGVTDLTGMNLVPFFVFAHYVPEYGNLIKQKTGETNYPVKTLTDDQAILVKDGKVKLITKRPEFLSDGN